MINNIKGDRCSLPFFLNPFKKLKAKPSNSKIHHLFCLLISEYAFSLQIMAYLAFFLPKRSKLLNKVKNAQNALYRLFRGMFFIYVDKATLHTYIRSLLVGANIVFCRCVIAENPTV